MSDETKKPADDPKAVGAPDFDVLAANLAKYVEETGRVTAAYLKPIESGEAFQVTPAEEVGEVARTIGQVAQSWLSDPQKALEAQRRLTTGYFDIWANALKKMQGEAVEPVVEPDARDKRFGAPEWRDSPFFDFLKQAYLHTTRWAESMVREADKIDEHTRHKADFYVKQMAGALAPTNFVATNPELLKITLEQSGANLVRGMHMLAEDIEAGKGQVKIRQSDASKFEVGVNMAVTPGKVVFRNDLIELIQYTPTTEKVRARPLLIVPPWINKFYILDLNPEKSFIRWCVAQGLTVFCISWVNPDERHRDKGFEEYMREGPLAALDVIQTATGAEKIDTIGYCVGGTMLAVTLAWMAAKGDDRIASATFFTTQVDFKDAGDLKVFVDPEQIRILEEKMKGKGYLDGSKMAAAFNMLRPNDLIWPYVVNVYLKGDNPFPFDLLVWNSDSTSMTEKNHAFYMRECYLENKLSRGKMVLDGVKLDLRKVTIPIYNLAAREDHIAPARSVYTGSKCFGGPVKYVVSGSGHIAGVVNPAEKPKYQYWSDGPMDGNFDHWMKNARETPGSWWPDWFVWLDAQAPERVKPLVPGKGKLKALCDAPGTYVKKKP